MDDGIELAPHRRSFRQGCHVSMNNDNGSEKSDKFARPIFEKKSRLTGRASGQRKNLESNYREHGDGSSNLNHNDYEKPTKRDRYSDKDNNRSNRFDKYADKENRQPSKEDIHDKEKYESSRDHRKDREKDNYPNERKGRINNRNIRDKDQVEGRNRRDTNEESLPEWMTDGPTSQLDIMEFTGFQDIEDEKKAYAKTKKKVRISPDVEVQQMKAARRSSTPRKPKTPTPPPTVKEVNEDPDVEAEDEKPSTATGGKPKSPNFDITEFFSEVNFYPPRLFHDDIVKGNGIRSRFTQYFQSKSRSNSIGSEGGNGPLLPNEIFHGVPRKSPAVPTPYFTPIQPASPVPMIPPATSSLVNLIQEKQNAAAERNNKEIKGRLNVEQIEQHDSAAPSPSFEPMQQSNSVPPPPLPLQSQHQQHAQPAEDANQSAFDLLVQSMKDAGQLPDKPAPVVTGLPDHLLPQPPNRSSPTFEKLKRSLSRSPSPAEFMKGVSTVASIMVSNPVMDTEIAIKKNQIQVLQPLPVKPAPYPDQRSTLPSVQKQVDDFNQSINGPPIPTGPGVERTPVSNQSINSSFNSSSGSTNTPQQRLPTAFLPTSVLKKMHSEKQRESPVTVQQKQSPEKSPLVNGHHDSSFSDLLVNSVRSPKPSPRESNESEHSLSAFDNLSLSGQLNLTNMDDNDMPFHSAPPTPRHSLNHHQMLPAHSNSAPNTPDHRFRVEPPAIHRVNMQPPGLGAFTKPPTQTLMAPSAFQPPKPPQQQQQSKSNDFGAIGSGIPKGGLRENEMHGSHNSLNDLNIDAGERRGFADPRLAPGNGVIRNPRNSMHSPIGNNANGPLSNNQLRSQMQPSSMGQQIPSQQVSQQQQLLHTQRMAQIHQAQLHQQQKLQQIANQAKMMEQQKLQQQQRGGANNANGKPFTAPAGVRPLLPDPESSQKRTGEQQVYQQQQRQQIQAYTQQQQQQQQRLQQQQQQQQQQSRLPGFPNGNANVNNNNINGFRNNINGRPNPDGTRTSPPMPIPLHQPGLQAFQNMNRPAQGVLPNNVNLAAQALVQQQLLSQAARARFIAAQTQLLQQPQMMQALMAQAALARGQAHAQAQAAMMFNHKNIQAMAEQMGIRPPLPHVNNKHIPTPMLNNPQSNQQSVNSNGNSQAQNGSSSSEGLSKWFGKDILNLLPQNNLPPNDLTTGKVMSVEELERKQRSS